MNADAFRHLPHSREVVVFSAFGKSRPLRVYVDWSDLKPVTVHIC